MLCIENIRLKEYGKFRPGLFLSFFMNLDLRISRESIAQRTGIHRRRLDHAVQCPLVLCFAVLVFSDLPGALERGVPGS